MSEFYIPTDIDVLKIDLKEHDKQIRAEVINEVKDIIANYHAHIDDDAMADIFSDLEQLKEQNNV